MDTASVENLRSISNRPGSSAQLNSNDEDYSGKETNLVSNTQIFVLSCDHSIVCASTFPENVLRVLAKDDVAEERRLLTREYENGCDRLKLAHQYQYIRNEDFSY